MGFDRTIKWGSCFFFDSHIRNSELYTTRDSHKRDLSVDTSHISVTDLRYTRR